MSKINTDHKNNFSVTKIKKVRKETGAGVMRAKQILIKTKGNYKSAVEILKKEGFEKMAKRSGRETKQGKVFTYEHHTGKVGVLVELFSETDFVAKNELFQNLGKDIVLQVASMGDKKVETQDFVKDPSKKISDVIKEVIIKTGENIRLGKVVRVQLGK